MVRFSRGSKDHLREGYWYIWRIVGNPENEDPALSLFVVSTREVGALDDAIAFETPDEAMRFAKKNRSLQVDRIKILRAKTDAACACLDCTMRSDLRLRTPMLELKEKGTENRVLVPKWIVCSDCGRTHGMHTSNYEDVDSGCAVYSVSYARSLLEKQLCRWCEDFSKMKEKLRTARTFILGDYKVLQDSGKHPTKPQGRQGHQMLGFGGRRFELERIDTGRVTVSYDMWHVGDIPEERRDRWKPNTFVWFEPMIKQGPLYPLGRLQRGCIVQDIATRKKWKIVAFDKRCLAESCMDPGEQWWKRPGIVLKRAGKLRWSDGSDIETTGELSNGNFERLEE